MRKTYRSTTLTPNICAFRLSTSAWVYLAFPLLFYSYKGTKTQTRREGKQEARKQAAVFRFNCWLPSIKQLRLQATGLVGAAWLGSINHNYFQKHDHHRSPAVKGLSSCSSFELMGAMSVSISYRCLLKQDNDELKSRGDTGSEPPFPRYVPSYPSLAGSCNLHMVAITAFALGCTGAPSCPTPPSPPTTPYASLPPTHSMRINVYYCCGGDSVSRPPGKRCSRWHHMRQNTWLIRYFLF